MTTKKGMRVGRRERVAVIGARGYVGAELLKLLVGHPSFEVVLVTSRGHDGKSVREVLPEVDLDLVFEKSDAADVSALHERGVRFHESIVGAGRNPFFLDALRRINRVRRLLSYRSMATRGRYHEQAREHLDILGLLEQGRNAEAADALRAHLVTTIRNLDRIRPLIED